MKNFHPEKWKRHFEATLLDALRSTEKFLEQDLMESKWGHRVLDQIFREGDFSNSPRHKPSAGTKS